MSEITQATSLPLNPSAAPQIIDYSYAETSLALMVRATEEFLDKADRVNKADLDRQDDDNPEPTALGEEATRAESALEYAETLQRKLAISPPLTEAAAIKLGQQVKDLVSEAEDMGIRVPLPENATAEPEDDNSP